MITIKRKNILTLILLILILILTFNNINEYVSYNNTILEHKDFVYSFLISGQKLTFNMSIYLVIVFILFPNIYRNENILVRFKNDDMLIISILKKGNIISLCSFIYAGIIQLIIFIIYRYEFKTEIFILSVLCIFLYSYSSFLLYNFLYLLKFDNSKSIAIYMLLRFLLLIIIRSMNILSNENNYDLIIYIYILLELIVTTALTLIITKDKERLII